MTVAHYNRLYGIAAGAEVNQHAFAKIQSQNGGVNGTLHTADDKQDTFTLNGGSGISVTDSTDKMTLTLSQDQRSIIKKIGVIGTANMSIDASGTGYIYFDSHTGPSDATGTHEIRFSASGQIDADGDIIAYSTATSSDIKLKENIQIVSGALEKVSQLEGVTFNWKKDGKESAGVIAQNVEEVLPSAVKDVDTLSEEGETHKVVDYNQLSALFIEAIKELKEENKSLRAEIESLKDINS
jgi:hypothetical protein